MAFKFVNSFILVWHSGNELSSKTQKLFFILKESSKCHNINYRAKNHDVLFWFAYRSRASSTRTRPTLTHIGWRVKENFPETFKSQLEKKKTLFTGLGQSVLGETVPSVWVPPLAYFLGRYSRPWTQFLPIRTSQPMNNKLYLLAEFSVRTASIYGPSAKRGGHKSMQTWIIERLVFLLSMMQKNEDP